MLHRISLLDELRKGGYEASLITTYNAYLPFYEDVILRRLINAGSRHNVLLMDERQYSVSVANHPPRLAGRQYTLLPMRAPGAFHPKLIFLAGKHKGLIAIGSHNLTLAGFGFNRELTNVVRVNGTDDTGDIALAQGLWREIDAWLEQHAGSAPDVVTDMVSRVRDFAPWLKKSAETDADIALLSGRPGATTLWEQLTDQLAIDVDEVAVTGAFFDRQLRFLTRVQADLEPQRCVVAIDPATVDMPPDIDPPNGCEMVNASELGKQEDEEGSRYLHAKGLLVRQKDGRRMLATGSANPSAPAWMADKSSGNVELMLAIKGKTAESAISDIGFDQLSALPPLDDLDWSTIREQREDDRPDASGRRARIAVAEGNEIRFATDDLAGDGSWEFRLAGPSGRVIATTGATRVDGKVSVLEFTENDIVNAAAVFCHDAAGCKLVLVIHHTRIIAEQSRTGNQRRLKDALMSLETDTPDISLLINCIDKIVFSKEETGTGGRSRSGRETAHGDDESSNELGSLEIDVADTKKRKTKQRLAHTGDFSYLLDALIYHLRVQEDKSAESLDRYGRNEEEQIGGDDDEDEQPEWLSTQRQGELLDLCHKKVRTVINRMNQQFKAYADGNQDLDQVLIRLLGVLAVLRELRRCDGRASWVEKGKTTVPREERWKLLEGAMLTLFEGKSSILNLSPLGNEFETSDDIARMKGLLLWLAWDCGLTLDLQKPFMESPKQLQLRLRQNAMVLALAQMVEADECVIEEARQSIGVLTSTEMDWLKEVLRIADECEYLGKSDEALLPASAAEPGDIAVHKTLKDWPLRIVVSSDESQVSLVRLTSGKDRTIFKPAHLMVARLVR